MLDRNREPILRWLELAMRKARMEDTIVLPCHTWSGSKRTSVSPKVATLYISEERRELFLRCCNVFQAHIPIATPVSASIWIASEHKVMECEDLALGPFTLC